MTTSDDPDRLAQRARAEFDAACDGLDAATANRLRIARRAALAPPPRRWTLAPLAGAIAVGIAAWLAWPRAPGPATAPTPIASAPATPRPVPDPVVLPVPAAPEPHAAPPVEPALAQQPPDGDEAPLDEASLDEPPLDEALADDPDLEALGEDDAELYAWLADAPVAPDAEGDAL